MSWTGNHYWATAEELGNTLFKMDHVCEHTTYRVHTGPSRLTFPTPMARSMFTTNTILNMRSSSPSSCGSQQTKEKLRFGFGQAPQGLMYQGVPVGTKASLWAPHSPACWSSTWPPLRQTRSECAGGPEVRKHNNKGQGTKLRIVGTPAIIMAEK